jgi:hypothetical protein
VAQFLLRSYDVGQFPQTTAVMIEMRPDPPFLRRHDLARWGECVELGLFHERVDQRAVEVWLQGSSAGKGASSQPSVGQAQIRQDGADRLTQSQTPRRSTSPGPTCGHYALGSCDAPRATALPMYGNLLACLDQVCTGHQAGYTGANIATFLAALPTMPPIRPTAPASPELARQRR